MWSPFKSAPFSRKAAAVQSPGRACGLYSESQEFHFVPRATHRHLWILCPILEAIPLASPIFSRLVNDSHLLSLASIYGPSEFWRRLCWAYSSDLLVFLTHEGWGKATGWDFHCEEWDWILKVSGTLETTWLVQLCLPTSQEWGSHSFERPPLSMLGGSSHWEVLSYWTNALVWDSTKQVRANLKVQFVETSQQIIPPITLA